MPFTGLCEDTYQFFWDIAFQNEISFFEQNKKRYEEAVKKPLLLLANELAETALEVDPGFQVRPLSVVSRIRKDTRYAPVDAPFRDHAYLSYRYPGAMLGQSFVLYAEFLRDSYGYGMGIYGDTPAFMAAFRKRALANPERLLSLASDPFLQENFMLDGMDYKRPKCPDAPKELWPWLNKRRFYYAYSSKELSKTLNPSLGEEVKHGFLALKPLYRFIMGME